VVIPQNVKKSQNHCTLVVIPQNVKKSQNHCTLAYMEHVSNILFK
jgi:hypothetical protein